MHAVNMKLCCVPTRAISVLWGLARTDISHSTIRLMPTFNDPVWVKVVQLDEVSRRQQTGEGHFPDLESVPTHAITLTIPALLSARKVLAIVPEGAQSPGRATRLAGTDRNQLPCQHPAPDRSRAPLPGS